MVDNRSDLSGLFTQICAIRVLWLCKGKPLACTYYSTGAQACARSHTEFGAKNERSIHTTTRSLAPESGIHHIMIRLDQGQRCSGDYVHPSSFDSMIPMLRFRWRSERIRAKAYLWKSRIPLKVSLVHVVSGPDLTQSSL